MADQDKFSPHIKAVALALWGDPNKALSKANELRWGTHGARSVDLAKGVWSDHSANAGGGVLDLIAIEKGFSKARAAEWMEAEGYIQGDRAPEQRPASGSNGNSYPRVDPDDPGYGGDAAPWDDTAAPPRHEITKTYDYTDEAGGLIFQVCRMEAPGRPDVPKKFLQRRPDPSARDGWNWKRGDVRQIPYRLPEVSAAIAKGLVVFIAEGEKDVDRLWSIGVPATCNAGGAKKWPESLTPFFKGARVVILPDNDQPGKDHRNLVGAALHDVAASVKWIDLPGLPEKGDPFDWISAGGDAEALYTLLENKAKDWSPDTTFESRFNAIPWRNLGDAGIAHEWLIKDVLTRGELSMVAGPSMSGKSFICIDMALSVCRGEDFFMHNVPRKGGVIYQAGEGGRGIRKRLTAYMEDKGLETSDDLPFVLLPASLDLYASDDHTNAFIDEAKYWASRMPVPLELIVIDTFSAATPGANENASEDMSRVLQRCDKIRSATGAHVMLVHHMNAAGEKPRGHTSIFANLENVILVTITENKDADILVKDHRTGDDRRISREIRQAVIAKQKDGESGEKIEFVLKSVLIDRDADNDPITSCVVEPPDRPTLDRAIHKGEAGINLTPQCAAYLRAVYDALDEYGEPAPVESGLPRDVRVVKHTFVKSQFERTTFEIDDDADSEKKAEAIKKAITRHGSHLVKNGIIKKFDRMIWLTGRRVKGFSRVGDDDPATSAPATTAEHPIDKELEGSDIDAIFPY